MEDNHSDKRMTMMILMTLMILITNLIMIMKMPAKTILLIIH